MKKRVLVRLKQVFRYVLINFIMFIRITKKIYLHELSSPVIIRPQSSDLLTFHQIFTFKILDMNLGFDPKFIIDAGANIGLAAVFYANKYPNAKIFCIEPEKSNFEMLKINSNNYKNVVLYKCALSNESNLNFSVIDKGYGNWGFITEIEDIDGSEKVVDTVKSITIEEIIKENNLEYIDLIKIDIEGGEKELFDSNYENWLPKTRCLVIELHDGLKMGCSKNFFKAISDYNFSYHNRGGHLLFINRDLKQTSY